MPEYTLKQKLGVLLKDWPRFERNLRKSGQWTLIHNRDEVIHRNPAGEGIVCRWKWTSDLHACKVFPSLGARLMRRTLGDWPVSFEDKPGFTTESPAITFIIGHRGAARLPHLLLTLKSIAAQRNVSIECVVVEQSETPEIERALPTWVRYLHTPLPYTGMPYCRSWAFNVGARAAHGRLLVLHDNDMLAPREYASQLAMRYREGYEVINLKRFIFYLTETESARLHSRENFSPTEAPETVMQNSEGGGSLAIGRDAYFAIGGFDESFVGWGGEDNEFWQRAETRIVWPYGYLPLLHLWHEPQAEKHETERSTAALFEARSAIPVQQRIEELVARNICVA